MAGAAAGAGAGAGVGVGSGAGDVPVVAPRTELAVWPPAEENTTLVRPSGVGTSVPPLRLASRVASVLATGRLSKRRASAAPGGEAFVGSGSAERVRRTGRSWAGERRDPELGARASVATGDALLPRVTATAVRSLADRAGSAARARATAGAWLVARVGSTGEDGRDGSTARARATAGACLVARVGSTFGDGRSPGAAIKDEAGERGADGADSRASAPGTLVRAITADAPTELVRAIAGDSLEGRAG